MKTTLGTLRDNVRTRWEHLTEVRWTDEALNEVINLGVEELAEATGFYERSAYVDLGSKRTYYDLRTLRTDEPYLGVNAVWDEDQEIWLKQSYPRELTGQWEMAEGLAQEYVMRGPFWLGVYPRPSADGGHLRIYYSALPRVLTDDFDTIPDLPEEYIPTVEDFALYELYAQEGETSKALTLWGDYQNGEKRLKDFVRQRMVRARESRMGRN